MPYYSSKTKLQNIKKSKRLKDETMFFVGLKGVLTACPHFAD